ncbi:MAG: tRNA (adenosine(37)-N6)-threonylcarbamoyltransferase complex ATPase subunit type 1 TsaE [Hyphomicrobiaceae bacterium]
MGTDDVVRLSMRVGERALENLARHLACLAKPGLVIALSGELGAGKSTFARAMVRSLCDAGDDLDVPSPTFAIAQTYEARGATIIHADLYRLSGPEELTEIGLFQDDRPSITIVEWPDRAAGLLPSPRLVITLADVAGDADVRDVAIEAVGGAGAGFDLSRLVARLDASAVVEETFGAITNISWLAGDASARSYARLAIANGATLLLMDSPPAPDGPPIEDGLAYSRLVHLSETVEPFVALAEALRSAGIKAPSIHVADLARGVLVIEDFGDLTFSHLAATGAELSTPWRAATDVLIELRRINPPREVRSRDRRLNRLAPFDARARRVEVDLFCEWAWPARTGASMPAAMRAAFHSAWSEAFRALDAMPAAEIRGWLLRDFHSPNLIWRPDEIGSARVGVIDFQDALEGPWAYDLASLLQDARVDLPEGLEVELFAHYVARLSADERAFDADRFATQYALLGAQRATKIIGIFHRLDRRDAKPGYLAHIPRVAAALQRNLAHPALGPVAAWFNEQKAWTFP